MLFHKFLNPNKYKKIEVSMCGLKMGLYKQIFMKLLENPTYSLDEALSDYQSYRSSPTL